MTTNVNQILTMDIDPRYHLLALEHIAQLKARYCRYIDTKQWEKLASVFTQDCRFEGLGSAPAGADVATFVKGVSARLAPTISVHHVHQPEVVLTSASTARGVWAMEDFVEWQDGGAVKEAPGAKGFRGYGHYEEEYRREGDTWKISFLRLTRLRIDPVPLDSSNPRMGSRQATPDWIEQATARPPEELLNWSTN
ncbi:nuclear transport factor 2 family protein [Variovorax sp. JS1663]|uniref:nuclear transport factor 2 family protein n=1 Tax=Variovorax sp. JS1663 TaxID=1851577 RepID=UPI00192CEADB|nr:nuclear transport factor 2 family protein [Variovorax sp. JS1663]